MWRTSLPPAWELSKVSALKPAASAPWHALFRTGCKERIGPSIAAAWTRQPRPLAMPIDSSLVVIAAAAIVLIGLVASSAFIGFHVGRRAVPENAGRPSEKPANPGRMPERV